MAEICAQEALVISGVIKVRPRGQITLPVAMRKSLGLEEGGCLTILQIGDLILARPGEAVVQREGREIQRVLGSKGVTLEDLLRGLERDRKQIYEERYGSATPA